MIEQFGVAVNDKVIENINAAVTEEDFEEGKLVIKKKKKGLP